MADHLFYPDAPPQPLWVAYDGPLYDGSDWDTFPARSGWLDEPGAREYLAPEIPYVKPPPEPEQLLQYQPAMECWLYFGMLHYVFGDRLDQSDFILLRENTGGQQQYITTEHLHRYVEDAEDWEENNRGARTVEIVNKVSEILPNYIRVIQRGTCLAIRLLSLALWRVVIKRDGPQANPPFFGLWFLANKEVENLLSLFNGWCPTEVEKCCGVGIHLDSQAYMVQLRRRKPSWNKRTHESCTITECVADNIDESSYVTRHVQEDCNCSHIHADIEQLHAILLDGGIPLVKITPSDKDELGNQRYQLEVVKRRTSKPYVAISHVWADGLGNPNGNSLPHCQLKFLYEQASSLLWNKEYIPGYDEKVYGPLYAGAVRFAHFTANVSRRGDKSVLVWIDTLCIPHRSDVRSLAIKGIRDVYTGASRTMILDSELILVDSRLSSKMEVCLRVLYCSGWIRRLWTLQEGVAANDKLFVLLSDKAINIGTIPSMLLNKVDQGEISVLQEEIATMAAVTWYSYFQEPTDNASTFQRLVIQNQSAKNQGGFIAWNWFNVATRATSKDRDRPTVLAGLLNLDVSKVLEVKEADERMRTIYSMLDMFPQNVIFLEGPRFEEYGMRWAMKECRYAGEPERLTSDAGNITPRGLRITKYPSLIALSSDLFDLALAQSKRADPAQRQMDWEQWLDDSKPFPVSQLDIDADFHAEYDAEYDGELDPEFDHEFDPDLSCPASEADIDADTDTDTKLSFLHLKDIIPVNLSQGEAYGIILYSALPDQKYTKCALVAVQTNEDGVHFGRHLSAGNMVAVTFDRNLHKVNLPEDGYLLAGTWGDAQKYEWIVG